MTLPFIFWVEEQDYDPNTHVETPVNPEKLAFASSRHFRTAQLLAFDTDGALTITRLTPSARIALTATDCVAILRLQ